MQFPHELSVRHIRGDETRDRNAAAVREQLRHLADPPDVLGAVGRAEAEVLVEAEADVVAVEPVRGQRVWGPQERLLEGDGDGRLAGRGEACEPDGEAALVTEGVTDGGYEGRGVEGYVAGWSQCVRGWQLVEVFWGRVGSRQMRAGYGLAR